VISLDNFRKASHTTFTINIHLVWTTKYRKAVIIGNIANRARELIREVCKNNKVAILAGHVSKDHVHLLVSIPPNLAISQLVQYIKGFSARKLLEEYKELEKEFWDQHLWGRGYFARSCGNVSNEVIINYIENQEKEDINNCIFQITN
jgi:Transposase and inactivated derivatives